MSEFKGHKWEELTQAFALAELKAGLEWKAAMLKKLAELGGVPVQGKRGPKSKEEKAAAARLSQQNGGDSQDGDDSEYEEMDAE